MTADLALAQAVTRARLDAVQNIRTWADLAVAEHGKNTGHPVLDAIQAYCGTESDGQAYCVRTVVFAWVVAGWANHLEFIGEDSGSTQRQWDRAGTNRVTRAGALAEVAARGSIGSLAGAMMCRIGEPGNHVEMVTGPIGIDGKIHTVGGNTGPGRSSDRDGDGIHRHEGADSVYGLDQSRVAGFVLPVYRRIVT